MTPLRSAHQRAAIVQRNDSTRRAFPAGTQCGVHMKLSEGDHIVFRLQQTANGTTLSNPLGMGLDYSGAEWTLTATNGTID